MKTTTEAVKTKINQQFFMFKFSRFFLDFLQRGDY